MPDTKKSDSDDAPLQLDRATAAMHIKPLEPLRYIVHERGLLLHELGQFTLPPDSFTLTEKQILTAARDRRRMADRLDWYADEIRKVADWLEGHATVARLLREKANRR